MKFNIANPSTGQQKIIEVEDDRIVSNFYEKRISQEVDGGCLGEEFKGYVFRITGGNDREGFAMKQGVLTSGRVRLLMTPGVSGYRGSLNPRDGTRKRKSVRGCIVSPQISVLHLAIIKKGEQDLPGLTDVAIPRKLGPKRASKIRKLFALTKDDDVRKYVIRREVKREGKKPVMKSPKIQRLVTPQRLQRKRRVKAVLKARWEKSRSEAETYNKLMAQRLAESKAKRAAAIEKRRHIRKMSQ